MASTYWSLDECRWVAYEPERAASADDVPASEPAAAPVPEQRPSGPSPRPAG